MKVVYIADDGKQFDNYFDCDEYEFMQSVKNIEIDMRDAEGNKLDNYVSEETYNTVQKVTIETEEQLEAIRQMYDWAGFYQEIDSIGVWKWDDFRQKWVK